MERVFTLVLFATAALLLPLNRLEADTLTKKDGAVLKGSITSDDGNTIVIQTEEGPVSISRTDVKSVEKVLPKPQAEDPPSPAAAPAVKIEETDKEETPRAVVTGAVSSPGIGTLDTALVDQAWHVLQTLAQDPAPTHAEVSAKLADLGPDAIPPLFSILAWTWGYGSETKVGQHLQTKISAETEINKNVSENQKEALLDALVSLRRDGLAAFLRKLVQDKVSFGFRMSASRVAVRAAMKDQSILLDVLGAHSNMDLLIIPQVRRIGRACPTGLHRSVLSKVRRSLADREWRVRIAAARALGELEDIDSALDLAALLADENPKVAEAALTSLRRISGMAMGKDQDQWSQWFQKEQAWLANEGAGLAAQMESKDAADVIKAMRSLMQKRLFKDWASGQIAKALYHQSLSVRSAACVALKQLRSPQATEGLIQALRDPDDAVRNGAWGTLKTITSQNLPLDAEAWDAWFKQNQ